MAGTKKKSPRKTGKSSAVKGRAAPETIGVEMEAVGIDVSWGKKDGHAVIVTVGDYQAFIQAKGVSDFVSGSDVGVDAVVRSLDGRSSVLQVKHHGPHAVARASMLADAAEPFVQQRGVDLIIAGATRSLAFLDALVSKRIANEEVGDALEVIHQMARDGRPAWWIRVKVVMTYVWVILHAVVYFLRGATKKRRSVPRKRTS